MKQVSEEIAFWVGACIAVVICIVVFLITSLGTSTKISTCEAKLPRDNYCVLVAVPKKTEDN